MTILVTGAAGFIGFHVCKWLCERGDKVVGIDNLNDYYSVRLKQDRLNELSFYPNFNFRKMDIIDKQGLDSIFSFEAFDRVIHLAAQAGVRYSLENPYAYIESNIVGFLNILECCRHTKVKHLVYASSSSVYGLSEKLPFSESDNVDHPVSLYAATKKSNEMMAHSYSQIYKLPTTGLRFFTVYGPWGRPDMSPMLFANAIMQGAPLKVFNQGKHRRDFTYIDDVVQGVLRILDKPAQPSLSWDSKNPSPSKSSAPWRIYNIGNGKPVELLYYIECIERALGKTTEKELLPLQPGDVEHTFCNVNALTQAIDLSPQISIEQGIKEFIAWYLDYNASNYI